MGDCMGEMMGEMMGEIMNQWDTKWFMTTISDPSLPGGRYIKTQKFSRVLIGCTWQILTHKMTNDPHLLGNHILVTTQFSHS